HDDLIQTPITDAQRPPGRHIQRGHIADRQIVGFRNTHRCDFKFRARWILSAHRGSKYKNDQTAAKGRMHHHDSSMELIYHEEIRLPEVVVRWRNACHYS